MLGKLEAKTIPIHSASIISPYPAPSDSYLSIYMVRYALRLSSSFVPELRQLMQTQLNSMELVYINWKTKTSSMKTANGHREKMKKR